ncbi:hypothetical protein DL766_009286 [Monosporascus sp. MC13-8B]|uniref:FAD-binding PCMH-type domain-containing protein n=1 Tax=Monosporascus cannonballus TaxID=155416 RepID=A0ABY0GYR9_9PEZI|nr:hypothetical protein DL762_007761 [Monosporascus cannonballus]RYO93628.1 hypothetical protein DL763_004303 [Monosporascus cannonballus]RYP15881.1 hypothetical protein DL766_009286 [Monosporascus sp. MC13-8B]
MKPFGYAAVGALAPWIASAASASKSAECCRALAKVGSLAGKVVYPDTELYEDRLDSYWSKSAALEPWCMVLPLTAEDVSSVVKVISKKKCPFGIRSGGHSQFAGSSSVEKGITIDLGYMNATSYDPEKKMALVRPGAMWRDVYATLAPHDVSITGGRADLVGVGGFITGGGYSFHLDAYGFACDNVRNFEAVLADGRIVNANANENADLWKALKGSSGNLGIVTRFDMDIIESANIWGGSTFYDLSQKDAVFNAYVEFAENTASDEHSQAILHLPYAGEFVLKTILSNSAAVVEPPAFADYLDIPSLSTTLRSTNISDITLENSGNQPIGIYADWFVGLYKNDIRIIQFVDMKHAEYVAKMEAALGPEAVVETLCQFQPVTESSIKHSELKGGNVLGLEPIVKDGATQMWLFTVQVYNAKDEAKVIPLAKQFLDEVDEYADSIGINLNWRYLNYAYKDQDPIAEYGVDAINTIKAAAAKYDPKGVFQKLRRSGFKIPA